MGIGYLTCLDFDWWADDGARGVGGLAPYGDGVDVWAVVVGEEGTQPQGPRTPHALPQHLHIKNGWVRKCTWRTKESVLFRDAGNAKT